jgi:hypothetical protein
MLHEYTCTQKKKAAQGKRSGSTENSSDFQAPELSSLAKLVSNFFY